MGVEIAAPALLLVLGYFLLFLEIAVVPGFGLLGIAGVGLLAGGAGWIWSLSGAGAAALSVFLSAPLFIAALWLFLKSGIAKKMVQEARISGQSSSVASRKDLIGARGVAVTVLRPSGVAKIGGERMAVVAEESVIEKGSAIVVTRIDTNSIMVEEVDKT